MAECSIELWEQLQAAPDICAVHKNDGCPPPERWSEMQKLVYGHRPLYDRDCSDWFGCECGEEGPRIVVYDSVSPGLVWWSGHLAQILQEKASG